MITPNLAHLRGIALNRFDRLPRLVYADWLDEQGDPDAANTAEFIRVGVALAEMPQQHRAALECDCDRCRLVRRQTEMFDAGVALDYASTAKLTHLGFEEVYQPVANYANGLIDHFRATFRKGIVLTLVPRNFARMAHAVGQAFRLMPIGSASIQFRNRAPARRGGRHHVFWGMWQIDVAALTLPKDGWFRVSALVGPVSNGRLVPTFSCEYLVNHVKRIPHLARVAVRRCLINRHIVHVSQTPHPTGVATA